jgi:DNA polymerase III alpha subunit
MLFVKIEDLSGEVEILVFPRLLASNPHMWQPDNIIVASGTVSDKDGERKVLCDLAVILNSNNLKDTLDSFLVQSRENKSKFRRFNFSGDGNQSGGNGGKRIPAGEIKVKPTQLNKIINIKLFHPLDYEISRTLKDLILKHQGNHLLELIVTRGEIKEKILTTFKVNYCDEFRLAAEKLLGEGIMEEIKAD